MEATMETENTWSLGQDGFVMQYMIAGPKVEDFTSSAQAADQLALEAKLRSEITSQKPSRKDVRVKLGEMADNGSVWEVQASFGNRFIDKSEFYSTLKTIHIEAATSLLVPTKRDVAVRIWTYMAVAIYVNGVKLDEIAKPVYKPMQWLDVTLPLESGLNEVYFSCDNLGVRDTRNLLGMQVLGDVSDVRVTLPDLAQQDQVCLDTAFLEALKLSGDKVVFRGLAPDGMYVRLVKESPDFYAADLLPYTIDAAGLAEVIVPAEIATIRVLVQRPHYSFSRTMEFADRRKPLVELPGPVKSKAEHLREIMTRIADVTSLNRGHFGFSVMSILARKYIGTSGPEDRKLLLKDLDLIERRVDCADFLVCGWLRYVKNYELDDELAARAKEVLVDFRYWMNMQGTDGMCFWSENHSLMFYSSAMLVGELYPDEQFPRAAMNGRELSAFGRDKVRQWLADLEAFGFEEFQSNVYMSVTFAALLNLVDYADDEISQRATLLCDRILTGLSVQTFKGCLIAPMGRVYRGNIYPFACGTQSILNWIDPSAPYSFGEGWLAYIATSKYQVPEKLFELMQQELTTEYTSGNALIKLEKTEDYCLTSVQSPRLDSWTRWPNLRAVGDAETDTHEFTKSLNESFHGTSFFEPGTFGYQQHLWSAALSPEAVLFVNHPGTSSEATDLRPGYWHGNGVIPAIKQVEGVLGGIYVIPNTHPIHFTHVYCPLFRFDETHIDKHWLFLKKDNGYLALWSSGVLEAYNDTIFGSEFRVYSDNHAYLCFAGSAGDFSDLAAFAESVKLREPVYDSVARVLTARNFNHKFTEGTDKTQYIA